MEYHIGNSWSRVLQLVVGCSAAVASGDVGAAASGDHRGPQRKSDAEPPLMLCPLMIISELRPGRLAAAADITIYLAAGPVRDGPRRHIYVTGRVGWTV